MAPIDEPLGGDPPCWAHMLEDEAGEGGAPSATAADLTAIAEAASSPGPAWTLASEDLNANLLVFDDGDGVAEHVNADLDVLLVGVAGQGIITIDGTAALLKAGQVVLLPKGARRGTRAFGGRFAYLTCHRRRAGLWPSVGQEREPGPEGPG